jgi:hypothetical protein
MTSMVLGDSTLESLTPNVNALLVVTYCPTYLLTYLPTYKTYFCGDYYLPTYLPTTYAKTSVNFTSVIEGTIIWRHLQASILKSEMLMYVSNPWEFCISKMLILVFYTFYLIILEVEIIDFYIGNAPPHQAFPYIYRTY